MPGTDICGVSTGNAVSTDGRRERERRKQLEGRDLERQRHRREIEDTVHLSHYYCLMAQKERGALEQVGLTSQI